MKNILLIFSLLLIGFIIYSCDDSLGYDPNVQITKLNEGGDDDTTHPNPSKKFVVDSVQYHFNEVDDIKYNFNDKYFDWEYKIIKADLFLDTSNADIELWIDLEMENRVPDSEHLDSGRVDRVTKFELSFNSVLTSPSFWLNDSEKYKRWLNLHIRDIIHSKDYQYNGSQFRGWPIIFISENNRSKGILKLYISCDIYTKEKFTVKKFFGFINLYYK